VKRPPGQNDLNLRAIFLSYAICATGKEKKKEKKKVDLPAIPCGLVDLRD
jgi:hypothetical protein